MFGLGKVFGGMASGFLDKLGLGKITPFVKMGLNALTGNWMVIAKDVFSLVSNFKSDFLSGASKLPPLGDFQQMSSTASPLSSSRMSELLNIFQDLFSGKNGTNGLNKIFNAFNVIKDMFDGFRQFDKHSSRSMFANLKM